MTQIKGSEKKSARGAVKFIFDRSDELRGQIKLDLDQDERIIEAYARRYFLDHGARVSEVSLRAPLQSVRTGDIIKIDMPRYSVPAAPGEDRFIVTAVETRVTASGAFINITAKRWDF